MMVRNQQKFQFPYWFYNMALSKFGGITHMGIKRYQQQQATSVNCTPSLHVIWHSCVGLESCWMFCGLPLFSHDAISVTFLPACSHPCYHTMILNVTALLSCMWVSEHGKDTLNSSLSASCASVISISLISL